MRKDTEDFIGTCACCFGEFKTEKKDKWVMVNHGYERPGNGYLIGGCPGINFEPYEYSTKGTEYVLQQSTQQKVILEKSLQDLVENKPDILYKTTVYIPEKQKNETKFNKISSTEKNYEYYYKIRMAEIERDIRYTEQYINYYKQKISAWQKKGIVGIELPLTGLHRIMKEAWSIEVEEKEQRKKEKEEKILNSPKKIYIYFRIPMDIKEQKDRWKKEESLNFFAPVLKSISNQYGKFVINNDTKIVKLGNERKYCFIFKLSSNTSKTIENIENYFPFTKNKNVWEAVVDLENVKDILKFCKDDNFIEIKQYFKKYGENNISLSELISKHHLDEISKKYSFNKIKYFFSTSNTHYFQTENCVLGFGPEKTHTEECSYEMPCLEYVNGCNVMPLFERAVGNYNFNREWNTNYETEELITFEYSTFTLEDDRKYGNIISNTF